MTPTLTPDEHRELGRRLSEWPLELQEQGVVEEVGKLLAKRELDRLPPLTLPQSSTGSEGWRN